jgi:hypothetical protein
MSLIPKNIASSQEVVGLVGATFYVTKRYEYVKVIGQGAYGIVCSAIDHLTNQKVAIKKVIVLSGTQCICGFD